MTRMLFLTVLSFSCGCAAPITPRIPPTSQPAAAVEDHIAVYFSPDGGALKAILDEIAHANKSIDVQAYLVTSGDIIEALMDAGRRGVTVRIVLDKNHAGGAWSAAVLMNTHLAVWRDGHHKDAHDKIMIFDDQVLITGSFNFTDESEFKNVENLLVIRNKPGLVEAYRHHFEEHLAHSDPLR